MNDDRSRGGAGREEDPGVRWMLAFQQGEEEAFDRIVEAYQGAVFGLLRRLLGPHPTIEDLAQEVFVRLYRSRERYRPQGRLSTFLYRITWNLALNALRDGKRQRTLSLPLDRQGAPLDLADPEAAEPSDSVQLESWAGRIEAALAALPENQRTALVLQHYDGLDLQEIGEILGISPKAVKSLLHRARTRMRELLRPYYEAEQ